MATTPFSLGTKSIGKISPAQQGESSMKPFGLGAQSPWQTVTGEAADNVAGMAGINSWMKGAGGYSQPAFGADINKMAQSGSLEQSSGVDPNAGVDVNGFNNYFSQKGYTPQTYTDPQGIMHGRLVDSQGNAAAEDQYDTNDTSWFEKAVPMGIAAMGAGAIGSGLGLFGGAGAAGDVAALGLDQVGAMGATDAAGGLGAVGSYGGVVPEAAGFGAPAATGGSSWLQSALGGLGSAGSAASKFLTDNPMAGKFANGAAAALGAGLATKALAGKAPTTPDASSLIQQQSNANLTAAQQQAQINRVDTTTPFGFQKFGQVADPSVPGGIRYTQEIGLSPEQQKLYDAETSNQLASQNIAQGMQGRVAQSVANPLDLSGAGQLEKAMSGDAFSADKDKVTQALFDRLTGLRKPQMDKDREALDVKLRNQGLMPGTEAYDNGMRSMLESQNTELSDAADRALLAGGAEQTRLQTDARNNATLNNQVHNQGVQEILTQRQQPLAEYNSFRTGNTPTLPTFQPFGLSSVQPTNTTAAANTQYQSQADAYNQRIAQLQSLLNFGTAVAKP